MQRPDREPALRPDPRTVRDLRGGVRLAFDAVRHSLRRVEAVHERLAEVDPPVQGARPARPSQGWAGIVYRGLHGSADLLGGGVDLALASLQAWTQEPQRGPRTADRSPTRDASVAGLNALLGDHLHRTDNPLATSTSLHLDPPRLGRVIVFAHDLGLDALHWSRDGGGFATDLAAALGATPACVRYNTGRHVWAVAREVAAALEQQIGSWPVPIDRVDLVGHGLGGLVLRSALHQAVASGQAWPVHVRSVVFLGTPLAGAQQARVRDLIGGSASGAQIGLLLSRMAGRRSDGMDDFLHGRWLDQDRSTTVALATVPALPSTIDAYAVAGSVGTTGDDGIVPVASALGRGELELPEARRWTVPGVGHHALARSDVVLQRVREWLSM